MAPPLVSACQFYISLAPARLDGYLAALPAMSLIPFTPFSFQRFKLSTFLVTRHPSLVTSFDRQK